MLKKSNKAETTEVLMSSAKIYKPSKKILKQAVVKDYEAVLKKAAGNPEKFWEEAARDLEWFKPWNKVFDDSQKPFFKWFVGGKCNLAYNALGRHNPILGALLLLFLRKSRESPHHVYSVSPHQ